MPDSKFSEALASNELVTTTPGLNEEALTNEAILGAASDTLTTSGVKVGSLVNHILGDRNSVAEATAPTFLPYGSGDTSILAQHPLTYPVTVDNFPATGVISAGGAGTSAIVHDPVRGMECGTQDSYRLQGLVDSIYNAWSDLDTAGQISIEVTRKWACNDSVAGGSDGYGPSSGEAGSNNVQNLLGVLSGTTGGSNLFFQKASPALNGRFGLHTSIDTNYWNGNTETIVAMSAGKEEFVTLNFGWGGGLAGDCYLAVDGVILATEQRNDPTLVNLFEQLYLGSGIGFATSPDPTGFTVYIRNLQISAKAPVINTNPFFGKTVLFGDSFANSALDYNNGAGDDNLTLLSMMRKLSDRAGVTFLTGDIYQENGITSWAGRTIGDYGGLFTSLLDSDSMTALEAVGAKTILLRAGTNDFQPTSGYTQAKLLSDFNSFVDTIFSWPATSRLIIGGVPSGIAASGTVGWTAQMKADRTEIDQVFQAISSQRRNVFFVDSYVSMGGELPSPFTYLGQRVGVDPATWDNLHPDALGYKIIGEDFAKAMLTAWLTG